MQTRGRAEDHRMCSQVMSISSVLECISGRLLSMNCNCADGVKFGACVVIYSGRGSDISHYTPH